MCRSFNLAHGRTLYDRLGIPRGTLRSRYAQLGVAFAMTTVSHQIGGLMMSGRFENEFGFFMLQPVAIAVEDGVLAVGKRLGFKGGWGWRLVGYAWVSSWLVWSGWRWYDATYLTDTAMGHVEAECCEEFCAEVCDLRLESSLVLGKAIRKKRCGDGRATLCSQTSSRNWSVD